MPHLDPTAPPLVLPTPPTAFVDDRKLLFFDQGCLKTWDDWAGAEGLIHNGGLVSFIDEANICAVAQGLRPQEVLKRSCFQLYWVEECVLIWRQFPALHIGLNNSREALSWDIMGNYNQSEKKSRTLGGGSGPPCGRHCHEVIFPHVHRFEGVLVVQTWYFFGRQRTNTEVPRCSKGCGNPVVKVTDHGRHVMSSSPVPLKTRREGHRCTLNLSRAETSSRWCGS
ncbi:hypothetical protein TNCV_5030851 [Trichonephila clavipes]|nr:hypothetical protein TNCV_5030851 [Trichonephila clavipes]